MVRLTGVTFENRFDEMEASNVTRESVLLLIEEKEKIELELSQLKIILDNNETDLTEALVDPSGFPRNDIDVYQVRHARHRIICLKNDHTALMKRIEAGLHELHGKQAEQMDTESGTSRVLPDAPILEPIVCVNLVSAASPAADAGLREGDLIVRFGSITARNFKSLHDIGSVVKGSQGQPVSISVKRDDQLVKLVLTPRPWAGQGLLGCNIVAVDSVDR